MRIRRRMGKKPPGEFLEFDLKNNKNNLVQIYQNKNQHQNGHKLELKNVFMVAISKSYKPITHLLPICICFPNLFDAIIRCNRLQTDIIEYIIIFHQHILVFLHKKDIHVYIACICVKIIVDDHD